MKPTGPSEIRSEARESVAHLGFLDGLRAVLALYVVAHHAFFAVVEDGRKGLSPVFGIFYYGQVAVSFFIILSGFCLALPVLKNDGFVLKKGAGEFFRRRAWRILPPYYCACVLSLLLIFLFIGNGAGKLWETSLPVNLQSYVTHLLLIHNFFPAQYHKINYVFWSIAVEWQIYFLFPLLLLCWRAIGTVWTAAGAVVGSLVLEKVLTDHFHIEPCTDFIGLFALGMLAAWISFSTSPAAAKLKKLPWHWIGAISFVLVVVFFKSHVLESKLAFGCFGGAVLIAASLHRDGWINRALSCRPLVIIGTFSYSLYLIHAPLLALLWKYLFSPLPLSANLVCAISLVIGIPVIVGLSYLFYLGCERPFLRVKDRQPLRAFASPALPSSLLGAAPTDSAPAN